MIRGCGSRMQVEYMGHEAVFLEGRLVHRGVLVCRVPCRPAPCSVQRFDRVAEMTLEDILE